MAFAEFLLHDFPKRTSSRRSLRSSEHAWNKVRLLSNVHTGRPLKSIPVQKDAVHLNVEPTKEIAELPQEEDALVKALSNFMGENEAQHFKSVISACSW